MRDILSAALTIGLKSGGTVTDGTEGAHILGIGSKLSP